jgi:hypothetical protein
MYTLDDKHKQQLLMKLKSKKKGKAIPVTGRVGPWGCETSRLQHFV